jgi:hypothetical protein
VPQQLVMHLQLPLPIPAQSALLVQGLAPQAGSQE